MRKKKPVEPYKWGPNGPCFIGKLDAKRWADTETYLDRDKYPGYKVIYLCSSADNGVSQAG